MTHLQNANYRDVGLALTLHTYHQKSQNDHRYQYYSWKKETFIEWSLFIISRSSISDHAHQAIFKKNESSSVSPCTISTDHNVPKVTSCLTQPEWREVPNKIHPWLSSPGHQSQSQKVSSGQHWAWQALSTKWRPDKGRHLISPVVELDVRASMARITLAFVWRRFHALVRSRRTRVCGTPGRLWNVGDGAVGWHAQQAVNQKEAELELHFIAGRGCLHSQVAVGARADKVILAWILVGSDDHAIPPYRLATEIHHIHCWDIGRLMTCPTMHDKTKKQNKQTRYLGLLSSPLYPPEMAIMGHKSPRQT